MTPIHPIVQLFWLNEILAKCWRKGAEIGEKQGFEPCRISA